MSLTVVEQGFAPGRLTRGGQSDEGVGGQACRHVFAAVARVKDEAAPLSGFLSDAGDGDFAARGQQENAFAMGTARFHGQLVLSETAGAGNLNWAGAAVGAAERLTGSHGCFVIGRCP